ncbi:MAG: sensor histidine kinase [Calditrichia bacterium]|nr:sensor histidine kinase [Calditrichia bacterium]
MNLKSFKEQTFWLLLIALLIIGISLLHYITPTTKHHYHLIYMQAYFIPILIASFQFGIRGGVISALAVSAAYLPHIMFQWGGITSDNLMRFLQIGLFNIIGFLTGYKTSREKQEKGNYLHAAIELEKSLTKLQEQTEILSQLEEQLHQTDRLAIIGELTASLAHEVRNPLGSILGTTQILKDELQTTEKQKEFLNILENETHRLNMVVENYLNFARKQKSPDSKFDIRDILHDVLLLLNQKIRKLGIINKLNIPNTPVIIKGNIGHLQQIIMNIVLNSIQAMPNGGELNIKLIKSNSKPDLVQLFVEDNGIGMKPETLKKIFKPFYTKKEFGTGLGLSIVKRIIDENHWQIDVNSEERKGSQFIVSIPIDSSNKKNQDSLNENSTHR